jgi:RND family efflux transporter MFP subunit
VKRFPIRALILFFCIALILSAAGCGQSADAVSQTAAIRVQVQTPTRGALAQTASFGGRITPDESVYVIGKVSGTVSATHYKIGDTVKKGDVLFEIDPADVNLSVAQVKAAYEAAQATVAQATGSTYAAQLLQAETALKQAQSALKWTDDTYDIYDDSFSSTSQLLRQKAKAYEAAAKQAKEAYLALRSAMENGDEIIEDASAPGGMRAPTIDEVEAAYQAYLAAQSAYQESDAAYDTYIGSYETQYNQLHQGLDQAEIGIDAAQKAYDLTTGQAREELLAVVNAQLAQAKAGYDTALRQLSYTKVTCPIDGVVEQKNVAVNGMSSPSSAAYVVSNKDALNVTFNVSAEVAGNMSVGDAVTVENGTQSHTAEVVEIANAVGASTGLFAVKARIVGNLGDLPTGLAVKLTAITAKTQNGLIIPVAAVYYDKGNAYVYTVQGGAAVKTPVTLGILSNDSAEVIAGLSEASQIVTTWNPNLTDGSAVEIVQEG